MKLLIAVVCGMALAFGAQAQDKKKEPSEAQKAQQQRMKDCNGKMGERKGEERQKAMSACLKGEDPNASAKQKAQQDRMKDCNKKAEGKKGDERKAFMSGCLKG
jgi:hypothetical protein